jgi:hypothetical protein
MRSDGPCCLGPASLPMQPAPGCVVARIVAHLPVVKQRQLCAITRIIRATADVERVVLFGSHARGDWVEDRASGYLSDFDVRSVSHKWRKCQGLGAGWKGEEDEPSL